MDFIFSDGPRELIFLDKEKHIEIKFFYRDPTADERIKYGAAIGLLFRGKDVSEVSVEDISKVQLEFGRNFLEGFSTSGIPTNISSDPLGPNYKPEWKDLIINRATDLIILLAQYIFETGGLIPEKNS